MSRRRKGDGWWNGNYAYVRRRVKETGYEPTEVVTETKLTDAELAEHKFNQYARLCATCNSLFRDWALPSLEILENFAQPLGLIYAIESSAIYKSAYAERAKRYPTSIRVKPGFTKQKTTRRATPQTSDLYFGNPTHKFGTAGRIKRRLSYCLKLYTEHVLAVSEAEQLLANLIEAAGGRLLEKGDYEFPDGSVLFT